MGQVIKVIVLCIVTFVLVVTFSDGKSADKPMEKDSKKNCTNVKCKDPPRKAKCTVVSEKESKSDSVPKPKGKQAECCPLWKCQEKSKSGEPEFYTFHGLQGDKLNPGGTETVRYKSTGIRSGNGDPIYNVVSSKATGKHDSLAFASDTKITADEMIKEMDEAFKGAGLNMRGF